MSNRRSDPRPRLHRVLCHVLGLVVIIGFSIQASADDSPIDLGLYGELLERHTRAVDDLAGTRVDYRSLGKSDD
jgi:hypothetical protein